jgi:hypothetical protein
MKDALMIVGGYWFIVILLSAIGFYAMWRERHLK